MMITVGCDFSPLIFEDGVGSETKKTKNTEAAYQGMEAEHRALQKKKDLRLII